MHPWTRTMHQNAMAGAARPPRTKPNVERGKRTLGWFSDAALVRMKATAQKIMDGAGVDPAGRAKRKEAERTIRRVENEQAERLLDPKEV